MAHSMAYQGHWNDHRVTFKACIHVPNLLLISLQGRAEKPLLCSVLGCRFPVNSADFWLCLRKFCGKADRGRLAGQRREFKIHRKSTAQVIKTQHRVWGLNSLAGRKVFNCHFTSKICHSICYASSFTKRIGHITLLTHECGGLMCDTLYRVRKI